VSTYIVTVKVPGNPGHDPADKKTGECAVSPYCTDVTGAHHSLLELGESAEAVRDTWQEKGFHVTRVEEAGPA
jgi:hypothetical protein